MTPTTASILETIAACEATTSTTAAHLREQIATLTDQLATVETELTELAITRTTLLRLAGPTTTPVLDPALAASPAYQQIITVLTTATTTLRARDICLALGTGTTGKDIEGLRAKLKRLVTRGILTEPEPGQFTITNTTTKPTTSSPTPNPNPERT